MSALPDRALDELVEEAVEALRGSREPELAWLDRVRPADGSPGLQWAAESTRPANVAATAYIYNGLRKMGLFEEGIPAAERAASVAWVKGLLGEHDYYWDPAFDRPSPGWPADKPWPEPAMRLAVNQYARVVLTACGEDQEQLPEAKPPVGWPQASDSAESIVAWIRSRPYDRNAWGACSHGMRMATYLLGWYQQGLQPLDPLVEALQFFYEIQDPETGLWGTPDQPRHVRLNGAFKLFPLMREQLDLPVPHADKLIDQVIGEFERPDYDATVGACDEWDNWYVAALVLPFAREDRLPELQRWAAWRLVRSLNDFRRADGGYGYYTNRCMPSWVGYDMAPSIDQGDAMGPGVLAAGINVCVDLLGLHGTGGWTGQWRMRSEQRVEESFRHELLARLRLPTTCQG